MLKSMSKLGPLRHFSAKEKEPAGGREWVRVFLWADFKETRHNNEAVVLSLPNHEGHSSSVQDEIYAAFYETLQMCSGGVGR